MSDDIKRTSRRQVISAAATGAAGLAVAGAAVAQPVGIQARTLNTNAKAVMPNGKALDRTAVLSQLGLDPNTPPDAWLTVIGCGSNASALKPGDLQSLVARGVLKANQLDAVSAAKLRTR